MVVAFAPLGMSAPRSALLGITQRIKLNYTKAAKLAAQRVRIEPRKVYLSYDRPMIVEATISAK